MERYRDYPVVVIRRKSKKNKNVQKTDSKEQVEKSSEQKTSK